MKILWITNILMPEATKYLKKDMLVFGGWMEGLLKKISLENNIDIAVASVYSGDSLLEFEKDNIKYYLIPSALDTRIYNKHLVKFWKQVSVLFSPDLVHIHGTEHAHGLAMMNACPENKYVISIQGLVSVYAKYYTAGLDYKDIVLNYSLKDIFKGGVFKGKRDFISRGVNEIKYLQNTKHVIGRTDWDRSHTYFINKHIKYHFCNEVLREDFYVNKEKWEYSKIEKFSIFLSQGAYPIKGLHQVVRAVSILKNEFPMIKVYIGGIDILKRDTLIDKLKIGGYANYIRLLIRKLDLEKNIIFKGKLTASEMIQQYLKSNLFICPSSIENSPNSIGEAQLLGVPCIASYVGGVPNMISHNEDGLLYRFEDVQGLAHFIRLAFLNENMLKKMSINAIKTATIRHDFEAIKNDMFEIYSSIIEQ